MNLLTIYPIQSCNLNCYYCPSKKFVYPVDSECNKINNDMIFKWIDYYLNPKEWMIEISGGGEPGLYPEINSLISGLEERGYYGLIKTNGTLPIPKSDHFKRIAAWHSMFDASQPPEYYDTIIIIKNPDDDWIGKVKYCEDHNIPHQEFTFIPFHIPPSLRRPNEHEKQVLNTFIKYWCVIYSGGRLSRCYSAKSSEDMTIQQMTPPPLQHVEQICPKCSNISKFERFLPQEWIDMFNNMSKE